jgi:tRNA (guanine-N7-)-methyltransferase
VRGGIGIGHILTDDIENLGRHFYGRRKGHPLTALQQARMDELLPQLRPDVSTPAPQPLNALFGTQAREVWLEIGFGAGEHLAWQAEQHPDVGIIGAEPFVNGMAQLLARVEAAGLSNVRLYDDEAQILLGWLPENSISRAFILFPDPWPKKRHHKRRIVSPKTIAALARVMRPGAELRVATDIADYVRTTLLAITANPDFIWPALVPGEWRVRSPDWPPTRYEAKAVEAGRQCYYFRFQRR